MLTTTLPGFENLTRDSQQTFRALLTALSEPGKLLEISVDMLVPETMDLACAAVCLTLIDFETAVWLQSGFSESVKDWLRFHTGCSFVEEGARADFALISDVCSVSLEEFGWGTSELPEASTTLLVQLDSLAADTDADNRVVHHQVVRPQVVLRGPGILESRVISPDLPSSFWQAWAKNHAAYPRGVDCFFLSGSQVMGLPRSTGAVLSAVPSAVFPAVTGG